MRSWIRTTVLGVMALSLAGCGSESYRYRVTVEVDTPQGVRTGSSVHEVSAWNTGEFLPDAAKRDWSVKGEAVAVDLPGQRTLFAVVDRDMVKMSMAALDPTLANDIVESAARIRRSRNLRDVPVAPSDLPLFVRFGDISNPASVEGVDRSNLSGAFGPGFYLRSVTVSKTDAALTTGIVNRLPWLQSYKDKGQRLSGKSSIAISSNHVSETLGTGSFSTLL